MQLDNQAQAVLLLTVSFGKSGNAEAKPLSTKEWARFAIWLRDHDLKPSSLLESALDDLLSDWIDRAITLSRLESLLGRGALLGLLLEKWQRTGLWVIARSDPDYPDRLKRRLKFEAPPILFGCGNKMLLKKGGIAVVGSRDATEEDITYTNNLGAEAAAQGYSIVSGGARGVDQSAMLGALECEGTAVGVLADSLLRSATSAKYRKYLMAGDLALVSPFNPEAGFNVGNAMARNRFIYCLADTAVVISSTPNKGGTWNGAIEDLETRWVPLWVKKSGEEKSGNPELIKRGGRCLPEAPSSLSNLFDDSSTNGAIASSSSALPLSALTQAAVGTEPSELPGAPTQLSTIPTQPPAVTEPSEPSGIEEPLTAAKQPTSLEELDLYDLFFHRFGELTSSKALSPAKISEQLDLKKTQTDAWLKRGVSEGKIEKLVRYRVPEARAIEESPASMNQPVIPEELALYELFLHLFCKLTSSEALDRDEVTERLKIEKLQTTAWLKRGVSEGKIEKLDVYRLPEARAIEESLASMNQLIILKELALYDLFLHRFGDLPSDKTLNSTEMSKRLNLKKTQTDAWLKRGVSEEQIEKLNGPVRYQLRNKDQGQQSLLFLAQDQAKCVPASSSDS